MVKVNPDQMLEDGYVVIRDVVPPNQLDRLRATFERMVDRQREIWARNRKPDDPPGGVWDTHKQPRLIFNNVADESTAAGVEFCLGETTLGVARQLMRGPEVGLHAMFLMCNPRQDHGPDLWHRDTGPTWDAPLEGLANDMLENGPGYVQWNIPLYDDNVLWVIPGSHRRANTGAENRQLLVDARMPLPGGIPVELNAGDGVVYTNFILHWGSNYSAKLRRTVHLGYQSFLGPLHRYFHLWWDMPSVQNLPSHVRSSFEHWTTLIGREHDVMEAMLRPMLTKDAPAFRSALATLHSGEEGRMTCVVLMCKLAGRMLNLKRAEAADRPLEERQAAAGSPFYLHLYADMTRRFSLAEIELLAKRFATLDARLQTDDPQVVAGTQSQQSRYRVYDMPRDFGVDQFITSWN